MTVTNLTPPVLSGTAQSGQTLATSNGTWDIDLDYLTYAYQWKRCDAVGANCVNISGATNSTYRVATADVGSTIRSQVTATEHTGSAPTIMLPGTRVELDTGEIAAWVVHDSDTTDIGSGSGRDKHRLVPCNGTHYMILDFMIEEGFPGRIFDPHNTPWPSGSWTPPPYSDGVSPFAVDFFDNARGLHYVAEAEEHKNNESHFTILTRTETIAEYGNRIQLWCEVVWAQAPSNGGSIKWWLAGENDPRVDESGISTCYQQQYLSVWEGAYDSTGVNEHTAVEWAATRIGRTPQEAFEDVPTVFVREGANNPNGPAGTAAAIADINGGGVAVPASLQW